MLFQTFTWFQFDIYKLRMIMLHWSIKCSVKLIFIKEIYLKIAFISYGNDFCLILLSFLEESYKLMQKIQILKFWELSLYEIWEYVCL